MGMDLIPSLKEVGDLHYNWAGWDQLCDLLAKNNVLTDEFTGVNDGDYISVETCREVANTLENHFEEEKEGWGEGYLRKQIEFWRECRGCRQW